MWKQTTGVVNRNVKNVQWRNADGNSPNVINSPVLWRILSEVAVTAYTENGDCQERCLDTLKSMALIPYHPNARYVVN